MENSYPLTFIMDSEKNPGTEKQHPRPDECIKSSGSIYLNLFIMNENDYFNKGENPTNYEQKCMAVFVLDRSGSMKSVIGEMNNELSRFEEGQLQDSIADAREGEKIDLAPAENNNLL